MADGRVITPFSVFGPRALGETLYKWWSGKLPTDKPRCLVRLQYFSDEYLSGVNRYDERFLGTDMERWLREFRSHVVSSRVYRDMELNADRQVFWVMRAPEDPRAFYHWLIALHRVWLMSRGAAGISLPGDEGYDSNFKCIEGSGSYVSPYPWPWPGPRDELEGWMEDLLGQVLGPQYAAGIGHKPYPDWPFAYDEAVTLLGWIDRLNDIRFRIDPPAVEVGPDVEARRASESIARKLAREEAKYRERLAGQLKVLPGASVLDSDAFKGPVRSRLPSAGPKLKFSDNLNISDPTRQAKPLWLQVYEDRGNVQYDIVVDARTGEPVSILVESGKDGKYDELPVPSGVLDSWIGYNELENRRRSEAVLGPIESRIRESEVNGRPAITVPRVRSSDIR